MDQDGQDFQDCPNRPETIPATLTYCLPVHILELSKPFERVRMEEMKKRILTAISILIAWNFQALGQVPEFEFSVDTSIYAGPYTNYVNVYPGPNTDFDNVYSYQASGKALLAARKKNSTQYDIFSFTGKIGSMTIPDPTDSTITSYNGYMFSQTFIDNDPQWECIVWYRGSSYCGTYPAIDYFKVFDNDGTVLLSDTGSAYYGLAGQNTYVFRVMYDCNSVRKFKAWRFRTNVSSASPGGLAKSAGSIPHAMMAFGPSGDYRITLAPASGGKTSVTLTDMLGRQVFSREVGNLTSPVTFTIRETGVPPTPFVAKVRNEKGTVAKREIPVR
jgi:hypothetical protein